MTQTLCSNEKHRYIHERVTVAYPQIGSKTMPPGFQYALEKLYGDAVGQVWDGNTLGITVANRDECDGSSRSVQLLCPRLTDDA